VRRIDCQDRMNDVQRNFGVALKVIAALQHIADPAYLIQCELDAPLLKAVKTELQNVYFAHLFNCFESSVRSFWASVRRTVPDAKPLIDAIGARRGIPQTVIDEVHEVREKRNIIVHEEYDFEIEVPFDIAVQRLQKFIARLPKDW
jgi:hypothetical protein